MELFNFFVFLSLQLFEFVIRNHFLLHEKPIIMPIIIKKKKKKKKKIKLN